MQMHNDGSIAGGFRFERDVHPVADRDGVRGFDVFGSEFALDPALVSIAVVSKHLIPAPR